MKTAFKLLLVVVCLLALLVTFTIGWRPFLGPRTRPLTNRHFESTPVRMARGEYLARNVLGCMECHSEHNWKAANAPIIAGKEGAGVIFPAEGLPGKSLPPTSRRTQRRVPEVGPTTNSQELFAKALGMMGEPCFP